MDNFYSNAYGNEPIVVNDKDFIISKPIWSTVQKDMLLTDSTPDSSIIYVTRKDRQEFYGMIIHLFYLIRKYTTEQVYIHKIDTIYFLMTDMNMLGELTEKISERIKLPFTIGVGNGFSSAMLDCEKKKLQKQIGESANVTIYST
jgi:hypothetical protein